MENILSVNLSTTTAPIVSEVRGKDWIDYGTEDWANLYPQFLIDLYYNSSTQAAIINATAEMIAGENIVIEDEEERELEAVVRLKKFFNSANGNETLHEVIKKIAFDFKLQGAFALNVVWSQDRTQIAEIHHIAVEKIRAEKPNALGKVEAYYVSADWTNIRENEPYRVPAFNTNDRTSPNQILYAGLYSPNMNAYHTPDYVAGNNWALVDQRVAEFHLNNISNGFSGSFMLNFANGVPTQEERFQIEQSLADKFTGADNAGKFILTFSDDKTRTPEIAAITPSDLDKQYLALQELLVQNILTAHRVTSPILMGIKSDTGLGNNADELNSAANFYLNTVVLPFQHQILKTLKKIFVVNNMDMPVRFEQLKPITVRFTNQDLMAVMTQDEIREELGLAPLITQEKNETTDALSTMSPLLANKVLNNLTLDETRDLVGLRPIDESELPNTEDVSMCRNTPHRDTKMTEYTALESFLDTLEDIPEDWELIKEEVVDGEHVDFDYEAELNKIANEKIELANTGRANPNARSSQDGLNKGVGKEKYGSHFYKVRYVYRNDNFLVNKSGTTRDFCRIMEKADKIYRKEDIMKMGGANPGFGIDGSNYYDKFLYKGGPQCHHYWLRQIYKAKPINDDYVYYPNNVEDEKNIGYTQARKEGFTAERNDGLVAIPPRRMKNHGYYK